MRISMARTLVPAPRCYTDEVKVQKATDCKTALAPAMVDVAHALGICNDKMRNHHSLLVKAITDRLQIDKGKLLMR